MEMAMAQADTSQKVVPNRLNSAFQEQKPYVILISLDGFRWDLADLYQAKNLQKLRDEGSSAPYLQSSFPSLTFPNHYGIVTGLYPAHHGIVDNIFYDKAKALLYRKSDKKMAVDSSWYGGKPLWVLAEEQKMLSAVYFWPGSEISMNGIRPTYYYNYNEVTPVKRRADVVASWLALPTERRPHFIAMYYHQVDKAAHNYKVQSEQTQQAVQQVDEAIGQLMEIVKRSGLQVNIIVVSDHGMTTIDQENTIPMPQILKSDQYIVPPGNSMLHVYAKNARAVKLAYNALRLDSSFTTYRLKDVPKRWHYGKKDDWYSRVGDLILIPKLPRVFNVNGVKPDIGQHGFDPQLPDMRAIFYALGPQLKRSTKVEPFENVHVYPLIANILGLKIDHQVDGKLQKLLPILE